MLFYGHFVYSSEIPSKANFNDNTWILFFFKGVDIDFVRPAKVKRNDDLLLLSNNHRNYFS